MSKVTLAISVVAIIYCGAAAFHSIAAEYPERAVRVIVPAASGSGPDVGTRIVVGELAGQLGKQFVVDITKNINKNNKLKILHHKR